MIINVYGIFRVGEENKNVDPSFPIKTKIKLFL